jgi:5-methylcytosine-specific restriction endonuclease McrA
MRREFLSGVKLAAWDRCRDEHGHHRCERCLGLIVGRAQYDHITPDGLGGEPTLDNCQVLCASCHRTKTHEEDRPVMTRADNQKKSHAGVRRSKQKIQSRGFQRRQHEMDPDT